MDLNMSVVKETNYNIIMMSSYSRIIIHEGQKEEYLMSKRKVYMFQYK